MSCCICFDILNNGNICCLTCSDGKICHKCFLKHAKLELKHRSEVLCPVCRTPICHKTIIMENFCFEEFDMELCFSNMPFKGVLCLLNLLFAFASVGFCTLVYFTLSLIKVNIAN